MGSKSGLPLSPPYSTFADITPHVIKSPSRVDGPCIDMILVMITIIIIVLTAIIIIILLKVVVF